MSTRPKDTRPIRNITVFSYKLIRIIIGTVILWLLHIKRMQRQSVRVFVREKWNFSQTSTFFECLVSQLVEKFWKFQTVKFDKSLWFSRLITNKCLNIFWQELNDNFIFWLSLKFVFIWAGQTFRRIII